MILLRIGIALACAGLVSFNADAAVLAGWSQYSADGKIEARIVTDEADCPSLMADGAALPMTERSAPTDAFPGRVCVAAIPSGSKSLNAGGRALPAPVAKPRHIVVIGDTGCRLKGDVVQACNDENAWPFHKVAESAAKQHPDLVIHVGDYLYRETPCAVGDARCAGTPTGDNWPTWQADFFSPGNALLGAATWLLQRGNHEDCKRGGLGWTALLGHDPVTVPCNPREKPMLVDLGGVKLALLDENDADDKGDPKPATVAAINADLHAALDAKADWIVTHHPSRGIAKRETKDGVTTIEGANPNLLAALDGIDESSVTLLLSGHIHNFQIENYAKPWAPQLVVGEGGDNLDTKVPLKLTGLVSGGLTITQGLSIPGFGYVVLDRVGDSRDWKISVHAANGKLLRRCALKAHRLSCRS